jgi:Icc-related predicted phosphoesterase
VIDGTSFWGLGAGVRVTPWDWSFDLDEQEAAEKPAGCPEGAVLASEAIPHAIEEKVPRLAVSGHIHQCWGWNRVSAGRGSSISVRTGPCSKSEGRESAITMRRR